MVSTRREPTTYQDNQVPVGYVEAREVLDGVLRVIDVFVNNKSRPFRVPRVSQPDLPDGPVLSEDIVQLVALDVEGQVANVKHPVHLWR